MSNDFFIFYFSIKTAAYILNIVPIIATTKTHGYFMGYSKMIQGYKFYDPTIKFGFFNQEMSVH